MCVVCASLRPWTPERDHAELELGAATPDASGLGADAAGRPFLTPEEAAHRILTDGWGRAHDAPYLRFDARAGDALTVDLSALGDRGLGLARAALAEWSAVTGLAFREIASAALAEGAEGHDVGATKEDAADLGRGGALVGSIGAGDSDWFRFSAPEGGITTLRVEGVGAGALADPVLALRDGLGNLVDAARHAVVLAGDGATEITLQGDLRGWHAEVRSASGATGDYRVAAGAPDAHIRFTEHASHGAFARPLLDPRDGATIRHAQINVPEWWLDRGGDAVGGYGFQTYLHEVGHALGLGHTARYNGSARFDGDATFANDSWLLSVMSYFDQAENPSVGAPRAHVVTPMEADLAAVRALYGPVERRGGDTVYGDGSNAGGAIGLVESLPGRVTYTIVDDGGIDAIRYADASAQGEHVIDLRGGAATIDGQRGAFVIARGTVIENVSIAGGGVNRVVGNAAANVIAMGGGWNTLEGREGDDVLTGGRGADRLHGGAFGEALASGDDRLAGGAGADELHGGDGDDTLDGGAGDDALAGGAGSDRFLFSGAWGADRIIDFAFGDRIDATLDGGGSFLRFLHDAAGTVLSFAQAAQTATIRLLAYRLGADEVRQDGRAVTIVARDPDAAPAPQPSADPVSAPKAASLPASGPTPEAPERPTGSVARKTRPDTGSTLDPADTSGTRGGAPERTEGSSSPQATDGDDTIRAGDAPLVLDAGRGHDRVQGSRGDDRIAGGAGRDSLKGRGGDDHLMGGSGRDRIAGGAGEDVLDGGAGNDWLKGGAGSDVFVLSAGRDRVLDFAPGEDRLDLGGVAGIKVFGDLRDAARERGGALVLDLDEGRLTLQGVALADLGADDVLL